MDVTRLIRHSFQRDARPPLILLVERDPHVRDLAEHYLHGAGLTVAFALDGLAGLLQADELRPDLVITEILVPHLDGLSLCRRLKSAPETADIAVLVCSILASRTRALEAGADAFLMKPLVEQRLLATVQELLEHRVARQEAQA